MYDLFMSNKVPIVGVLNKDKNANLSKISFDMEIMGVIQRNGLVSGGRGEAPNLANPAPAQGQQ